MTTPDKRQLDETYENTTAGGGFNDHGLQGLLQFLTKLCCSLGEVWDRNPEDLQKVVGYRLLFGLCECSGGEVKRKAPCITVVATLRYGRSVETFGPESTAGYAEVKRYIVLMQLMTV